MWNLLLEENPLDIQRISVVLEKDPVILSVHTADPALVLFLKCFEHLILAHILHYITHEPAVRQQAACSAAGKRCTPGPGRARPSTMRANHGIFDLKRGITGGKPESGHSTASVSNLKRRQTISCSRDKLIPAVYN
jgi:hypothetical protein